MSLLPDEPQPTLWGERFRVTGRLGQGAMGTVHRARDLQLGVDVALKVISGGPLTAARLERFRREGEIAASLDHPGIVRLHAAGELRGRPFLAYELVPGAHTLDQVIPHASAQRRLELIRDAARALGHAHARGVVHRDVKPENLLVDLAGQLRVADFGVGAAVSLDRMTQSGVLVGTPMFMAPEQVRSDRVALGPHTDVWALGAVLYWALTDSLPFQGDSLAELAKLILEHSPPPPASLDPSVSAAASTVCMRALSKSAADRYADGTELATALDELLALPETAPRRPARWLLPAGLTLLAVAVAIGGWLASPSTEDSRPPAEPPPTGPAPTSPATEGGRPAEALWLRAQEDLAGDNPERAFAACRQAAEAGAPEAMHQLGLLFRDGRGVARSPQRAVEWFREAAQAGSAQAMTRLGRAYARGFGVEQDLERSAEWFRKGGEAGDPEAMCALGFAYYTGRGLPLDFEVAVTWYERGAALDHMLSIYYLGIAHENGRGVARDLDRARELYERGVQLELPRAMVALSTLYLQGKGVDPDPQKAVGLLQEAGRRGWAQAWTQLGVVYRKGLGVPQDDVEAARLFKLAAEAGDPKGLFSYGLMLQKGAGVTKDHALAAEQFRKAAERGDVQAMAALGVALRRGDGVEQDEAEGVRWLRKAAAEGDDFAQQALRRRPPKPGQ